MLYLIYFQHDTEREEDEYCLQLHPADATSPLSALIQVPTIHCEKVYHFSMCLYRTRSKQPSTNTHAICVDAHPAIFLKPRS